MSKPFKVEVAEIIRDSIHNLVIDEENELDNEVFSGRAKYFIRTLEGTRFEAYLDGIPDPDKKSQFISAAKFYSYSQERRLCCMNRGTVKITDQMVWCRL